VEGSVLLVGLESCEMVLLHLKAIHVGVEDIDNLPDLWQ
jgi:hypothetical protein